MFLFLHFQHGDSSFSRQFTPSVVTLFVYISMSLRPLELQSPVAHTGSLESPAAWLATLENLASFVGDAIKQGQRLRGVLPQNSEFFASGSSDCIAHGRGVIPPPPENVHYVGRSTSYFTLLERKQGVFFFFHSYVFKTVCLWIQTVEFTPIHLVSINLLRSNDHNSKHVFVSKPVFYQVKTRNS